MLADDTTSLANERLVPLRVLSRVGGAIVLPIEEKQDNEKANREHSIDRQRN